MTCFFCKGELERVNEAFMVESGERIIVVKNVPSNVCAKCGQKSFENDVARRLEKIVNKAKEAIEEVAVVQYSENVA